MELHKALKEIVASKGAEMINNIQIINYLLDYQAFKEKPATKLILRDLINSGYAEKIINLNANKAEWQTKYMQYQHEFIDSCGYKEDLTIYVFESIAFALGLNLGNSKPQDNNEPTIIAQQSICLPHGVTVGDWCSVILPSHEIVTAKLEIIIDGMAGIRLRNFRRMKVPISSLMQLLKDITHDK